MSRTWPKYLNMVVTGVLGDGDVNGVPLILSSAWLHHQSRPLLEVEGFDIIKLCLAGSEFASILRPAPCKCKSQ